jgi:hypothetical protein
VKTASLAAALSVVSALSAMSGCSGSSSGTATAKEDSGARHDSGRDSGKDSGSCTSTPTCTGGVSGGVTADLATCTVSGIDGVKGQFAEVTFGFTANGGGSVGPITGGGDVSTKGSFAAGSYVSDGGLWNDTGTSGSAADSLWTVAWGSEMAECNGIHSPDDIDSLCADAKLDVTSIDPCNGIHGTFDTTIPEYMGTPGVTIHLAF